MKGIRERQGLRMAGVDLLFLQLFLQRSAGGCDAGEPALLALPDDAPWKIS